MEERQQEVVLSHQSVILYENVCESCTEGAILSGTRLRVIEVSDIEDSLAQPDACRTK
jgi:hypothetical protein